MTLTDRQRYIVDAIERGQTREEIAEDLDINPDTVRDTERKLRRRFGVETRFDLPEAVRRSGRV